jgi:hypothetical protein
MFMIFCLFAATFNGRILVSPSNACNIKFVQRGFTERAALEGPTPALCHWKEVSQRV